MRLCFAFTVPRTWDIGLLSALSMSLGLEVQSFISCQFTSRKPVFLDNINEHSFGFKTVKKQVRVKVYLNFLFLFIGDVEK